MSYLSELGAVRGKTTIRVRVITKWVSTPRGSLSRKVGMILGDARGFKIEASSDDLLDLSGAVNLEVGSWFEICNFSIRPAMVAMFKKTKSHFHIKLTKSSVVSKIEPISDCNFISLGNFNSIISGFAHPKFCVDLCGALVGVGDIQDTEEQELADIYGSSMMIQFSLINIGLTELRCVAYGNQAEKLNEFWLSTTANTVICVLSCWRIEWRQGHFHYITNLDGSQILFDENIPEIKDFKSRIPQM